MTKEEEEFIEQHGLFAGISSLQMEILKRLFQKHVYSPGDTIIKEGETGDCIFIIFKGSAEVTKNSLKIATLRSGDIFGEMELIDIQRRAASVIAVTPLIVLTLGNRDMYDLSKRDLKTFTLILMNLAREISRRLRKMDEFVLSLMQKKSPGTAADCPEN